MKSLRAEMLNTLKKHKERMDRMEQLIVSRIKVRLCRVQQNPSDL
jgi:hypothetical protein